MHEGDTDKNLIHWNEAKREYVREKTQKLAAELSKENGITGREVFFEMYTAIAVQAIEESAYIGRDYLEYVADLNASTLKQVKAYMEEHYAPMEKLIHKE